MAPGMNPRTVAPALMKNRARAAFWFFWSLALVAFVVLASFAAAFDYFPGDRGLAGWIQGTDTRAWREALDWASHLSEWPGIVIVSLAAAAALWLLGHRSEVIWLVAALALTRLNDAVKLAVDRPRPSSELVEVREVASGLSFPSGHAVATVLLYGFLFYAAGQALSDRRLRYPIQALCVVIAVLTGLQRVEAGVHWPSDVLGGALLGGLILALLIWSHRRFQARWSKV
jgi:membrane-associated phospholipid phosphatase